jgi:hypothetical protein
MEKSLHMGIVREDYIGGKRNLLEIRAGILELSEKLSILKDLKSQKAMIYKMLVSDYKSLIPGFEKIKGELPKVDVRVENDVHDRMLDFGTEESTVSSSNKMQNELLEIQAKLERLNAIN